MRRSRMIALVLVCAVGWAYGFQTWKTSVRAEAIALGLEGKPFVFRALAPWIAQVLMALGLPAGLALSVLVIFSAIGLFYGLKYLSDSFRS